MNINHEFRVRNGGHTFEYWRGSLTNGLHFIDDAFNKKTYRGDANDLSSTISKVLDVNPNLINNDEFEILLPEGYNTSFRYYPVIYFIGKFDNSTKSIISNKVISEIKENKLPPIISIFIDPDFKTSLESIILNAKKNYRIRDGRRFQSLIGFKEGGTKAMNYLMKNNDFTSCAIFDSPVDIEVLKSLSEDKIKC